MKDYWNYLILLPKTAIKITILLFFISSVISSQTEQITNENVKNNDTVFVMTKSPWGAVLRSAVIPGWGQIYNESYWKTPIIIGLTAYFVYGWIDNNKLYNENKDLYNAALINNSSLIYGYKKRRDFYRDQRDMFLFYIGLTYFLNMVDAYVDAQMFDFTVSEDAMLNYKMLNIKFYF